jgi:hypothetical protein
MGPFPNLEGYEYILVVVDYVSKWVKALPCRAVDAMRSKRMFHEVIRNTLIFHEASEWHDSGEPKAGHGRETMVDRHAIEVHGSWTQLTAFPFEK